MLTTNMKHRGRIAFVLSLSALAVLFFATGWMASPARAELIGFYSFDDPADPFHDDSGNGMDLYGVGADPEYQETGGFTGGAFVFNGSQRLLIPLDIFWGEEAFPKLTMGAWVRTSSLNPGLRKVIGGDDGGYDRVLGLDTRPSSFGYTTFLGSGVLPGGPPPVSTEKWTFLAVSYDQEEQRAVLYVGLDAGAVAPLTVLSAATAFGSSAAFPAALGSVGPNGGEGWQGAIDNVFFYNEVLTPEQITAIRNGGKAAILGTGGDDPGLTVEQSPDLRTLSKSQAEHVFSFQIKNTGVLQPLVLSGVTLSGPDASHYSVVRFPASVAPGATDTIDFKFEPRGQVGNFTASALVVSNDAGNPTRELDLSAGVPANTLLALYTFDDAGDNLKDDSGNGRALQPPAAEEQRPVFDAAGGVGGGAWIFDGAQHLVVPLNIRADALPWLTMGAWVKPSVAGDEGIGYRKVIGNDTGWSRVIGLDPRPASGFGYTGFTGNGVFSYGDDPTPAPLNTDDWTFLAVSYEQPLGRMTMHVDLNARAPSPGAMTSASAQASHSTGTTTTSIGSLAPGRAAEGWHGAIDNVFFISGRLSAAEIQALRDGGAEALRALRADPVLAASRESPFGTAVVAGTRTVSVPLRNSGSERALEIVGARVTGPNAANYTLGAVPASIPPGGVANLDVTFNPGSDGGVFQATLEIVGNDQTNRLQTIDLRVEAAFASPKDALLAFHSFDDPGDPLKDDSGRGRTLLTVDGAEPEYLPNGGFGGGGYLFSGAQRLISPVNGDPSATPRLTMGAWARASFLDGSLSKILGTDNGGYDRVLGLDNRPASGYGFSAFTGSGLLGFGEEPTPLPVSEEDWVFVAATYDQEAAVMTFYIDVDAASAESGLLAVSTSTSFGPAESTVSIGSVGPGTGSEGWIGEIDNVFFYKTVLTPEQVLAIRNGGRAAILEEDSPPPPPAPLRVLNVARDNDGVRLTWESSEGSRYEVHYSASLAAWETVATVDGTAGSTTWTDTSAARLSAGKGFYRIRQASP